MTWNWTSFDWTSSTLVLIQVHIPIFWEIFFLKFFLTGGIYGANGSNFRVICTQNTTCKQEIQKEFFSKIGTCTSINSSMEDADLIEVKFRVISTTNTTCKEEIHKEFLSKIGMCTSSNSSMEEVQPNVDQFLVICYASTSCKEEIQNHFYDFW